MKTEKTIRILSGVFEVSPNKLLTLNASGMIKLTPKKTYLAFKTNYTISNQPGKPTIMILKDGYRWFPVNETYARNNFRYVEDKALDFDVWLKKFQIANEHIRTKERANFVYKV